VKINIYIAFTGISDEICQVAQSRAFTVTFASENGHALLHRFILELEGSPYHSSHITHFSVSFRSYLRKSTQSSDFTQAVQKFHPKVHLDFGWGL